MSAQRHCLCGNSLSLQRTPVPYVSGCSQMRLTVLGKQCRMSGCRCLGPLLSWGSCINATVCARGWLMLSPRLLPKPHAWGEGSPPSCYPARGPHRRAAWAPSVVRSAWQLFTERVWAGEFNHQPLWSAWNDCSLPISGPSMECTPTAKFLFLW